LEDLIDELKGFIDRNLTLINLAIAVCSLVSYAATMYLLAYWTNWTDSTGAYGGVLDYRFLGISTIFHVTAQNVQGQALFAFPDVTAYFLIALIVLNFVSLRPGREAGSGVHPRRVAVASFLLALICIVAYAWGTMIPIAGLLKPSNNSPGGVITYNFPFGSSIYHVTSGSLESMGVGWSFDFTAWLLFAIITLNLIATARARGMGMVKVSSVFGIIGGIFAVLAAMLGIVVTHSIFIIAGPLGGDLLYASAGICAVGGFLGIAGGVSGKKLGGALMVVGSICSLTGGILFGFLLGVLPFILMLVGGVLTLTEETQVTTKIE